MMISHQYLSSIGWNVCEIDAMTMEPEITNTENDMTAHTEQTTTPAINAAGRPNRNEEKGGKIRIFGCYTRK